MVRAQIKHALADCGVRHVAEDREGLFGEFARSRLYFSHNDTGRAATGCGSLWAGQPRVHMVFHFEPGRLALSSGDFSRFIHALDARSDSTYLLLLNGSHIWNRAVSPADPPH
jgi:hypothetical protein